MYKSTETTRFLNHIERLITIQKKTSTAEIVSLKNTVNCLQLTEKNLNLNNETLIKKISSLEKSERAAISAKNELIETAKKLLLKMRTSATTPRWFTTQKWWSRETGGLSADEIADLNDIETMEALEFYSRETTPLLLQKSKRDEHEKWDLAQEAWTEYMALPNETKSIISFGRFCQNNRWSHQNKPRLDAETEQSCAK